MLIFPNCILYCFNSFVSQTQDHFIPLECYRSRSPSFSTPFPRSLTALRYSCYKTLASEHSCPNLLPTGPIHLLALWLPLLQSWHICSGPVYSQVSSATTLIFRILGLAISRPTPICSLASFCRGRRMSVETLSTFIRPMMPPRSSYPRSTCSGAAEWEGPTELLANQARQTALIRSG